ncbi:MAG: DUF1405 domain-containing protein [Halobacteriaceae archaeon]
MASGRGSAFDWLLGAAGLPEPRGLPRYVAPLPTWLENLGLNLATPIAVINLAGTAFGFWYYRFQFAMTEPLAWPLVPDSPMATLFIAASLVAWRVDYEADWLHMLAFFGCLKLGLWTPFVQLVVNGGPGQIAPWLYWFLIVSHLGMTAEGFLIHRYASFSIPAVTVALAWYWLNDVVDYLLPVAGDLHHTILRAERVPSGYDHGLAAHDMAAAAAISLTLLATLLALSTRIAILRNGPDRPQG